VAANRKIEHGPRDLQVRGAALSGKQYGYKHHRTELSISVVSSWKLYVHVRWGVLCTAVHSKHRLLQAMIAHILNSLAGKKQTPSTSRAHLRQAHCRLHYTATTLPYTQFMPAYSPPPPPPQMLRTFRAVLLCNVIKPAQTCKRPKRIDELQQCRLSATALNSIKVTAQLNRRVKPTLSLRMASTRQF
jgi:hypothetical protein